MTAWKAGGLKKRVCWEVRHGKASQEEGLGNQVEKIIGIGIDLIERERVVKSCQSESFLQKCFSEREREEIAAHPKRAATDFAGKEAVAKALGTGFTGICLAEIEILRKESGAPQVFLQGRAKEQAQRLGVTAVHISLTDSKELAGAYVICVGEISEPV